MSPHKQSGGEIDPSQLRNFIEPPIELQKAVNKVAGYVAKYGPASEFQLRSGDKGRQQFPFLFLDNEYAPFYQYKVAEARLRIKNGVALTKCDVPVTSIEANSSTASSIETKHNSDRTPPHRARTASDHLIGCDDLARLEDFTYDNDYKEQLNTQPMSDPTANVTSAQPSQDCSRATSYEHELRALLQSNPFSGTQQQYPIRPRNHQPTALTGPSTPCVSPRLLTLSSRSQGIIPYGPLQEVHLLDSEGTERSGLNTFIVISNSELENREPNNPLEHYLNNSPEPISDHEPTYRLRPDTTAVFRATHRRLLPVGLPLGIEVEIVEEGSKAAKENTQKIHEKERTIGIVIRRTVQKGTRLYDVKALDETVHRDLKEEQLRLHHGGCFNFRMPST